MKMQLLRRNIIFFSALLILGGSGAYLYYTQRSSAEFISTTNSEIQTLTSQLLALSTNTTTTKGTSIPDNQVTLNQVAQKRADLLVALMKSNPKQAVNSLLTPKQRDELVKRVDPDLLETTSSVSGVITTIIQDSHLPRPSLFKRLDFIREGDKEYRVNLTDQEYFTYKSGDTVNVLGTKLRDQLLANNSQVSIINAASTPKAISSTPTIRKVLGVRMKYLNSPLINPYNSQPYVNEDVRSYLFGDKFSVNEYYKKATYGKLSFTGDVTPWLTINKYYPSSCENHSERWQDGLRALQLANYNIDNYDHVVFYWPDDRVCIGAGVMWGKLSSSYSMPMMIHEIGHNLGMWHADSYVCGEVPIAFPLHANCINRRYGSLVDVMGMGGTWYQNEYNNHFDMADLNVIHKEQIGLLGAKEFPEITSSGIYSLDPLTSTNLTGVKGLKIPFMQDGIKYNYSVEFRNYFQLGGLPGGLFIMVQEAYSGLEGQPGSLSNVLDMVPDEDNIESDALQVGKAFYDPTTKVKIEFKSIIANKAVVAVTIPPSTCIRRSPTLTIPTGSQSGLFTSFFEWRDISIKNNDSDTCLPSTFNLSATNLPDQWQSWYFPGPSVVLKPGETKTVIQQVQSRSTSTIYNIFYLSVNGSPNEGHLPIKRQLVARVEPLIRITNPYPEGVSIKKGTKVPITVNKGSTSPVSRINISIMGTSKLDAFEEVPVTYLWDTSKESVGKYTISARGYLNEGYWQEIRTVNIVP